MSAAFPPVPEGPVDADGRVLAGRYAGALDAVRWGYPTGWLHGQVRRALGRKRWFQAGVVHRDRVVIARVVDQGLVGSGLVWVADMRTGRTLIEQRLSGIPLANLSVGPLAGRGTDAHVMTPQARVRLHRPEGASAWFLEVNLPGHAISIGLDTRGAPVPMTLIGEPVAGDGVLVQRFVGLEARGTVRFRSEVEPLPEGAMGFLEYGNGFFPRPLAWSTALLVGGAGAPWAFASDLPTFGEAGECALWERETPRALAPCELSGDAGSREPWRVRSGDGALELSFQPRAMALETTPAHLPGPGSIAMRHALVAGTFEGRIKTVDGVRLIEQPGLCEARAFGL